MKIKSYGNSAIQFRSKSKKLVTNPISSKVKINIKKLDPNVVVLSHDMEIDENGYYIIRTPGEYEVEDIFVYGYSSDLSSENSTQADIYVFDVEGIHSGFIDMNVKKVREWVITEMGIVDVLFVSLAAEDGMKLTKLTDLVNKIEPYIVVPMNYTKESLDEFVKIMGIKSVEKMPVLDVKMSDFSEEDMPLRCVVLE